MRRRTELSVRLLLAASVATGAAAASPIGFRPAAYAPDATAATPLDTIRVRLAAQPARARRTTAAIGAVVPGYLSSRGLPPVQGRVTITDTGLVFRAVDGSKLKFPLVGPVRGTAGKRWRAPAVSLAYIDAAQGRPVYVFRVDAGVFETDAPGPLLDVASRPGWLDSVAPSEWVADRALVSSRDSAALWATARGIAMSPYADSLYTLFGRPRAPIGLIGARGRRAGRLGEYMGGRDSLAMDPGRMTVPTQLRHTLAHELGHRWQSRAPAQLAALWAGVGPMRDPKRYGYGNASEHQAEAIAFAINFLQTTAAEWEAPASSMMLLDHYELLVPGTRTMVRYLALQPLYRSHRLRALLTTGYTEQPL